VEIALSPEAVQQIVQGNGGEGLLPLFSGSVEYNRGGVRRGGKDAMLGGKREKEKYCRDTR